VTSRLSRFRGDGGYDGLQMTHPRSPLPSRARRFTLFAAFALLTGLFPAGVAAAEPPTPDSTDQVLVRYRAETTRAERARVAGDHGLTAVRTSPDGRTQVVVAKGRSPATARRELKADPRVLAVSNNFRRELTDEITEEFFFGDLWGLHNTGQEIDGIEPQIGVADVDIDGLEALRIEKGDASVVVAVVDDGVDFTHPDLADRAWTNPGESGAKATNGLDDDNNGHIDDVHGWDFCNNDNTVSDPGEDFHGTHVAGTIAASLNGTGIVCVAPGVTIMAVKFIDGGPTCGSDDMAVAAIDYAASFGVPIINASWGGSDESDVLDTAIGESGALFVAAAGNAGLNIDAPGGPRFYPANSVQPNVVTIAAIDQTGHLASFSNYGTTSVDISAPGTNILSSIPDQPGGPGQQACNPCWAWIAGTSMAAPHVSGVAALALSALGGTPTPVALRARVLGTGVPLALTAHKTATARLVNAWRAIDVTGPVASPIQRYGINVGSTIGSTVSTTMTWVPATDDLSGVRSYLIKRSLNGGTFTTLASSITTRSYKRSLTFGTPTRFQLFARDGAGNYGAGAIGPSVRAFLLQDSSVRARYSGSWSTASVSTASGGRLHRSTRGGAAVVFTTTARAIAVVGRRGPLNGKAKVYVDGVYRSTISLRKSTSQSKVVVFNASWTSTATHSIKVVVVGGTGRVEIDAFAFLR
jgi:subtilisin family serine protease